MKKHKKVLIICTRWGAMPQKNSGAIENLVGNFLKLKKNNSISYTVYSGKFQNEKIEDYAQFKNIEFRYIEKSKLNYRFFRIVFGIIHRVFKKFTINAYNYLLVKDLKKSKIHYDLIIFENEVDSILYFCKKIKNIPIVLHLHNDYLNIKTPNALKILNSCEYIWGVSNFICERVKEIDCKTKVNIDVLYNGINIEKISSSKKTRNDIEQEFAIPKNKYNIIYVGRLMEEKGVLEIIKSFKKIKKIKNDCNLIIVGKELKKKYRFLLNKESKDEKNIYFLEKISQDNISDIYKIASLQVIGSKWNEAFGLIAVEGLANGIPIIATNSGGLPEILENEYGVIINKENIENELPVAIEKTLKNLKNIDKNKLKEKAQKFNINCYVDNFESLIEECLNGSEN